MGHESSIFSQMIPFITKVKEGAIGRCHAVQLRVFCCVVPYLWTQEPGHCPIMLDKVCKLLKAFQVATSG